ncbi:TIGR04283 family arsenosugar biosynthesis glycosyltransferase [Flavobacteriaceae bacterium 3-367]|uniref:TIGR04283 family arsenosugar biosynthesis glycosyltransferase n=1 Tax=Eudoraea algarum TaxID=3417568 RepID=UPI0032863B40
MKQNKPRTISIIVPVLNEEEHIGKLLDHLAKNCASSGNIEEILIVDGGSTDRTAAVALDLGAKILPAEKGRAKQMNYGAQHARGDLFYFLHADTLPPKNFDNFILKAKEEGFDAGCFRMRFDSNNWALKLFAWFTKVNHRICRGGDQSLFISRSLFQKSLGFDENYIIYEDNEFIGRLYKITNFKILPQRVQTSARKYEKNGWLRLQYHFGVIHLKKFMGAPPGALYDYYRRKVAS